MTKIGSGMADVLIADYSSLIYEYLLIGKALVLYVPDLEEYRSRRGFYMDIEEIPAQIVTQQADLAEAVRYGGQTPNGNGGQTPREHFLRTYMEMCDGRATGRIAKWMNENIK